MFLCAEPDKASAAGTPCSITPVLTEADLNTCIAEAPTDNSEFTITIGADFNITATKSIPAGKNITLTSINPASPATLTRGPGFTGQLFNINVTAADTVAITIDSVFIDGNNPTAITNNQLVYATGTGNATVNLVGNTVLRNNNSASSGGAVWVNNANCKLSITGSVQIVNNTSAFHGGAIYVSSASVELIINGATFSHNEARIGGAIFFDGGANTLTITDAIITYNKASEYAGAIFTSGTTLINGSTMIDHNEIASESTTVSSGGAIWASQYGTTVGANLTITDNVRITNNTAGANYGGILITNNNEVAPRGQLNMSGNVIISGNTAPISGGGVALNGPIDGVITGNVQIFDNIAKNGGGFSLNGKISCRIAGNVQIFGNVAGENGGGIFVRDNPNQIDLVVLEILGSVKITNNKADGNGGGVFAPNDVALNVAGSVELLGNTAGSDGGGVYTEDYNNLTVGAGVIFASNRASFASPTRNPADDAVYATNILGTNWTTPFTQGYNNYDINHDYAPDAPGTGAEPSGLGNVVATSILVSGAAVTVVIGMVWIIRIAHIHSV